MKPRYSAGNTGETRNNDIEERINVTEGIDIEEIDDTEERTPVANSGSERRWRTRGANAGGGPEERTPVAVRRIVPEPNVYQTSERT